MLKNYFKVAIRNLSRNKSYAFINILGLSIGMACSVLIYLWIDQELSYDDFHKQKDRIYRINIDFENTSQASICGALGSAAKNEIPEIKNFTRVWTGWESQLTYNEDFTKGIGRFADPSFLTIFTFPMIEGDPQTALEKPHSIVLTESMANKLFGKESPIGKVVQIKNRWDEKENFEVTGVLDNIPENSHMQFDFLYSFNLLNEWYRPNWAERWTNFSFITYILANENVESNLLSKKITDCYNNHKETPRTLHAEPLKEVYLNGEIQNLLGPSGSKTYVKVFTLIGILLLVIACINYMNLATAKAFYRAKEVGLRKVIGARKAEIIFQNLSESIISALLSFPITLLLIELFTPLFNNAVARSLVVDYSNPNLLLGLFGLVILTGLVSGFYPAIYTSSFSPARILQSRNTELKQSFSFRTILVVFQFTISIIIIISAWVTSSQIEFIKTKNLGFIPENIVYGWVLGTNNDILKSELLRNPNIISVGASGAQLDWIGWWQGISKWDGKTTDENISFGVLEVGYDYLNTYKMQMAEGRYYSEEFPSDLENAIIVNQASLKAMNISEPIGKAIYFNGKNRIIIGVVKDFHYQSLHDEIGPLLFTLYPQQLRCLGIRISGNDIKETLGFIKTILSEKISGENIELFFLKDKLEQLYTSEYRQNNLFFYFSLIAIFIASLGLFGLGSYSIERRKKEISIRKVLGASFIHIIIELTKRFVFWILLANLIAAPLAYYLMDRWLEEFTYKTSISWEAIFYSGSIAIIIAFLTVSYQAVKASLVNPVESLKYE